MTGSSPKVTVIIPTFNRAHYLGQAIESVLQQTFTDFELIIVDDGSTDDTRDLVSRFRDERIRYFYQANRGISGAMNTGLKAARGAYLARLDSDDLWLPEKLTVQVAILDAHPDIGLVYAQGQAMDKAGKPLPIVWGTPPKDPHDSFKSMLAHDCTCNITVMVRRECFDRVGGFDESLATNEDWDMWLRVSRYYQFHFLNQVVARFRLHDESITHEKSPLVSVTLDERIRVLEKVFSADDLPPEIRALKPKVYFDCWLWTARCWMGLRNYRKSLEHIKQAIQASEQPLSASLIVIWCVLKWRLLEGYDRLRRWLLSHREAG